MQSRIAYKCAGCYRPTHLLGYASLLGTLFLAAMFLQPLLAAEFGDSTWLSPAEDGDLVLSAGTTWAEDGSIGCDDATCMASVACDPTVNSGCRRYFFADAIYWTVREGGDENWAQVITPKNPSGSTNAGSATLTPANFDWNTGLRVGMGVQRNDGFEMTLYYTNYHTSAANQASGEVYSAFMGNFYIGNTDGGKFGPYYRNANIRWDFDFHSIDFEISRNYIIATNLELRPFLGLKATIINQSMKTNWQNPINTTEHTYNFTSATENQNPNFWGIGPSLGVTMTMPLCNNDKYNLKMFGAPSGAVMLGHWTCTEQYDNNQPTSVTIGMSPITGVATMLRGVVGFEWEQYFSRATSTVRLGYEAQIWLNQVQFYSYNMGRLNNLTSLQGGFLELCIAF
jgi:hypothetical protein